MIFTCLFSLISPTCNNYKTMNKGRLQNIHKLRLDQGKLKVSSEVFTIVRQFSHFGNWTLRVRVGYVCTVNRWFSKPQNLFGPLTRGSKKLTEPVLTLKQGYFAFRYIHISDLPTTTYIDVHDIDYSPYHNQCKIQEYNVADCELLSASLLRTSLYFETKCWESKTLPCGLKQHLFFPY